MNCRHCATPLNNTVLDLGFAPPSNAYLAEAELYRSEKYYPLKVKVCTHCWLVQTEDYAKADELFSADYAYFSSTTRGWLAHAAKFTQSIIGRLNLNSNSHVIEVASNDGYLLKNFTSLGIPCVGIEPTASTAAVAEKLGIPVLRAFFGESLAQELASNQQQADLIIGNNVYAHVPDINDFTRGLKVALKANGTITLEFPHLMRLMEHIQFDTIYHEHFSYLSLYSVERIFKSAGLRIWDVEQIPTHGGSLRIYGCHAEDFRVQSLAVSVLLAEEKKFGLQATEVYKGFQASVNKIKDSLLSFLIMQKRECKSVVGYGAAAKGNTLINYAGIKSDLLPYVCDAAVAKQGKYLPGSHIPILHPDTLRISAPDYVLILPWNIATEVKEYYSDLVEKGIKFVTAVPELKIHE